MAEKQRSTKRQRELLNFVDSFIQGHGYGPSYREIMRALNYKSVSTVAIHVEGLIAGGYLRKKDRSARSLEVVTTRFSDEKAGVKVLASQEKWLVEIVQNKFNDFKKYSDPKLLDEVYVLVGSLKILGLDGAYVAMKAKLLDYLKSK